MNNTLLETLHDWIKQASYSLDSDTIAKQVAFVELLDKWNKSYNLTSVRDPQQMLVKHTLDSLAVLPHLQGKRLIDVGTGPGLPAIPLAIASPDQEFTPLDSLGKRVRFMRQAVQSLGLKNVFPVQSRVEEFKPENFFDVVLSRAFASLSDMLNWCHHLVDDSGRFLALKGQLQQQELDEIPAGFEVVNVHQLHVPQLVGERHLVEIKKSV